jgi:hypothetical protein
MPEHPRIRLQRDHSRGGDDRAHTPLVGRTDAVRLTVAPPGLTVPCFGHDASTPLIAYKR